MISEFLPDLILLDYFLPSMNGLEILSRIHDQPEISKIPVIILTNSFHPVKGTEIEKYAVLDFVIKSNITPQQIMNNINTALGGNPMDSGNSIETNSNVLNGKRILVVEDDNFLGSIITSRLSSSLCVVIAVKNGEDALKELETKDFDAALLDVLLPGISGFEVLESIRKNPKTKDLPVTVISNFNQVKDKDQAGALGADFLVKALVDPDMIVKKVEAMISKN
jgi:CheY-like chemotaxis protein